MTGPQHRSTPSSDSHSKHHQQARGRPLLVASSSSSRRATAVAGAVAWIVLVAGCLLDARTSWVVEAWTPTILDLAHHSPLQHTAMLKPPLTILVETKAPQSPQQGEDFSPTSSIPTQGDRLSLVVDGVDSALTMNNPRRESLSQAGIRQWYQQTSAFGVPSAWAADAMTSSSGELPPSLASKETTKTTTTASLASMTTTTTLAQSSSSAKTTTTNKPPTKEEVNLLRQAFAAFYGTGKDVVLAEQLLSEAIDAWQRQPADEQAGLYRVRGDCYMALSRPLDAIQDYSKSISLLLSSLDAAATADTDTASTADPAELPASYLGRARAIRSLHTLATPEQRLMAVQDYEQSFKLSSREEWDTDQELLEDGARTNPYATWEYGVALRLKGDYQKAMEIHRLAATYFDDIGDRARSVISMLDAGIDAASMKDDAASSLDVAKKMLQDGIEMTKTVEGRDIALLQRVIAKEGEARMALASLDWTTGNRPEAETQLGLACQRLDQLEADAINRNNKRVNLKPSSSPPPSPPPQQSSSTPPPRLLFNIDDGVSALDISCTRLRNREYLTERLEWPTPLQERVGKLYSLSK